MRRLSQYYFLCLSLFLILSNSFAQTKVVFYVDSTSFDKVYSLKAKKIGINPISQNPFIVGDFIATDNNLNSIVPFFYYELNKVANPLNYFNNSSITAITQGNSAVFDENGNCFIAGGSNENKILSKINDSLKVEWTKSVGHHGFTDVDYYKGIVYAIGQDEDTFANHTTLLTKIDVDSNNFAAKNFGNTFNFNQSVKVIANKNGVFCFSRSMFNGIFSIFVFHTDDKLNLLNHNSLFKTNSSLILSDATEFDNEFYLTGYIKANKLDSTFICKLDSNFNPIFFKTYSSNLSFNALKASCITVDSSRYIYVGGTKYDENNRKQPFLFKTNSFGSLIYSNAYSNNEYETDETVNDIQLLSNSDTIMLIGDYRKYDSLIFYEPGFYTQKVLTSNGISGCSEPLIFKTSIFTLKDTSIIKVDDYLSWQKEYPFYESLDFMTEKSICKIIEDTIVDTIGNVYNEFNSNIEIKVYSNEIQLKNSKIIYSNDNFIVTIFNILGEKLVEKSLNAHFTNYHIPINNLINGIYVITIKQNNQQYITRKFLIER